jgi:hypothetical protein
MTIAEGVVDPAPDANVTGQQLKLSLNDLSSITGNANVSVTGSVTSTLGFTGSLWGGPVNLMIQLHSLYDTCLKELYDLRISDYDQHIYLRCFLKMPSLFQLYISHTKWPQVLTDFQIK